MTTKPPLSTISFAPASGAPEFKVATSALPKSVFETVSAFANTGGGWIVPSVTQDGERVEVSGVDKPDKVQNDLLSARRA